MPKSSIDSRTPISAMRVKIDIAPSGSAIRELSVISTRRRPGLTQLPDQRQPAAARLVVLERVEGVTAARAFRDVHRDVRAPQKGVGIVAVERKERDPDAGADMDLLHVDAE